MHGPLRHCLTGLLVAASLCSAALAQPAAGTYPTKTIRFILPFPPGSGTDIGARILAQQVTSQTGQPVVVDNRAGGNGLIAAQAAAQAPADGYTVFITTMSTQVVNLFLFKKLPYDPARDFAPVTLFAKSPMLLVVRNTPDAPKTVAELTDRIRRNPGKITFASGNTSSRVAAEMYRSLIGGQTVHVPYKGTPQALVDVTSGQIEFMFPDLSPSVPLAKSGQLRALGVTGSRRVGSVPDIPTMAEHGVPVDLVTWSGAFVPAGTPRPVIERLNKLLHNAMASREYQEQSAKSGTEPTPLSPEQFGDFVRAEVDNWGRAVKAAGIQPE
jgi:tripartite-type tricarboxylate transporter receptor subunit TctC